MNTTPTLEAARDALRLLHGRSRAEALAQEPPENIRAAVLAAVQFRDCTGWWIRLAREEIALHDSDQPWEVRFTDVG